MYHTETDDYLEPKPTRWQRVLDRLFEEDMGVFMMCILFTGACCCASPVGVVMGGVGCMACSSYEARTNAITVLVISTLESIVLFVVSAPIVLR